MSNENIENTIHHNPFDPELDARDRLTEAMNRGDLRSICQAKSDYALSLISSNKAEIALIQFQEALDMAMSIDDFGLKSDLQCNLGLALIHLDRVEDALEVLRVAYSNAESSHDKFGQKLTLERISMCFSKLGDTAASIKSLETAAQLARAVGDQHHEFRLLWLQAIEYAGNSQKNQAVRLGVEGLGILRSIGADEARWYAEQLRKYRDEGSILSRDIRAGDVRQDQPPATGPGLLRIAMSATKAMTTFLGTGMKLATEEIRDSRLSACNLCEYHTGLRCRVCGCFTRVKSGMAHERCPIGRWQD